MGAELQYKIDFLYYMRILRLISKPTYQRTIAIVTGWKTT